MRGRRVGQLFFALSLSLISSTVFSSVLTTSSVLQSIASGERDYSYYRELLINSDGDTSTFGAVCEAIARIELEKTYPEKDYLITGSIEYSHGHRTLGELDVVILRRSDREAVLIGEVKCWKNLDRARKKAVKQLTRFKVTMNQNTPIQFHAKDHAPYARVNFDESPRFVMIAQQGAVSHGFDMELPISLDSAKSLASDLSY